MSGRGMSRAQHLDMSRCWALPLFCPLVVSLQRTCPQRIVCPLVPLYSLPTVCTCSGVWSLKSRSNKFRSDQNTAIIRTFWSAIAATFEDTEVYHVARHLASEDCSIRIDVAASWETWTMIAQTLHYTVFVEDGQTVLSESERCKQRYRLQVPDGVQTDQGALTARG